MERFSNDAYDRWRASRDGQLVYIECQSRALRLRLAGRRHFGLQAIFEAVRYDTALEGDRLLKLNNSFVAPLARDIMRSDSRLEGFFETRRSAADAPR